LIYIEAAIFFDYICLMRYILTLIICVLFLQTSSRAQDITRKGDTWSLQRCIQFALDHNISIRQDSLTARLARYTLLQSKLMQLPSLTVSGDYGRSFGRSVSPTTNQFVDASYNFMGPSASSNVLLFGWMQVRNSIVRNRYSLQAAIADLDQLKNDVSLNVANSFLTALLAQEQIEISKRQAELSKAQLDQTRAFADAGRVPELNVAQLESQLASDSSTLINAIANYNSALLDLKTLLNIDFTLPFDIAVPDVQVSEEMSVSASQPEEVFQAARKNFGSIKASELRVSAADKGVAVAKAALYPQVNLSYQAGSNWASNFQTQSYELSGLQSAGLTDSLGHPLNNIYMPGSKIVTSNIPLGTQLNDNFRQILAVNLSIPIFNSWSSQYALRQARINLATQQLNQYNAELTLKQNVYKAHNSALSSIEKYKAAKRADDAARRALEFARKRYELGLTSTVDLLVTQNQEYTAAANLVSAKYDLIFKLKVIDYYLGKELKL
jgi:outer membrane protein